MIFEFRQTTRGAEMSSHVRAVTIDGEPWFVAADICSALNLSNTAMAVTGLDDDEKGISTVDTRGGAQPLTIISESGLYSLMLRSRKPEAKQFKRWLTHDVLPSIRKTGSYTAKPLDPLELFAQSVEAMRHLQARQMMSEAAVERLEQRVNEAAETHLMLQRPANAEAITHIRERIRRKYGLSDRTIDTVMRQLPYSPKPAGMVKNAHEDAQGGSYAVYWSKDINAVFARFVSECQQETATQATHPFIHERFKLTAREAVSC